VEGPSFDQESHGDIYGHMGGGWVDITLTAESVAGLKNYKPTVVPFAFYANNDLGSSAPAAPMDNLTRTQAINIFSGSLYDWGQFCGFDSFIGKGVQVCLRHAGSGTHATLDKAVMRGDSLITQQLINGLPGTMSDSYFYQSSDSTKPGQAGMKQCIESNGGNGVGGNYIAMGYLDADAAATANMHQMKYQGASAADCEIANGTYDFWSAQNVYLKTADDTPMVKKMMAFASANIPTSKIGIWVKANDLNVTKASDKSTPLMK
jgi:ABC-type phosphate transport system substrate-binding protein